MVLASNTEPASLHHFCSIPTPFFVRTRYAFEPPSAPSGITQVLSFGPGELAIIHHVEPYGWGEANILKTGRRGWIPSNYCILYEPEPMRPLLQAMMPCADAANAVEAKQHVNEQSNNPVVDSISKVLVLEYSLKSLNLPPDTQNSLQTLRVSLLKRVSLFDQYIKKTQTFISPQQEGDGAEPTVTSATELQKLAWGIIVTADIFMTAVLGIKSSSRYRSSLVDTPAASKPIEAATTSQVVMEEIPKVRFMLPDTSARQSRHSIQIPESGISSKSDIKGESLSSEASTAVSSGPERLDFARPQKNRCSLAALVEYLTCCEDKAKTDQVESTFFLTWKLFCTANELLSALVYQFDLAQLAPESEQNRIRFRVCHLIRCWLESSEDLSTDAQVLDLLHTFLKQQVHQFLPRSSVLLFNVLQRVRSSTASKQTDASSTVREQDCTKCEHNQTDVSMPELPRVTRSHPNDHWSVHHMSHVYLASQITVKQMALFCTIQPRELLGGKWLVDGAADAPNVAAMSHLTNNICNWVKESILEESDSRIRGLVTEKWILIANYMFQIGNFDGLVAITSALDDSSIMRLQISWHHVSAPAMEVLQSLKRIVDPSQNRKTLRALFATSTKPHLPFLGAYLSELIFTEGHSKEAKHNKMEASSSPDSILINWEMYVRIASIIRLVMDSQVPFPIAQDDEMQKWIESRLSNLWCKDQNCSQRAYYNRTSGRILGAQIIGKSSVGKRIDVIATAMQFGGTVFDLEHLELGYAPPYGSAKDGVNMAGFVASNVLRGDCEIIQLKDSQGKILMSCRL
ncbi:Ras guanine-nucleotide exchange Cdc25p [Fusarium beomiforme]|uniref:Ras guanine-nucleotide exchange Cdc25p n=1 Tax=Fusarium beomiforme TaxID=44412 RepID=A0A9P5DWG8_9HYPO|nr:Ras guanine-nucleotide exchange Cdc25p [Fusarium beomiforme]